jgi:TRAP-type transport system periplasmic protein
MFFLLIVHPRGGRKGVLIQETRKETLHHVQETFFSEETDMKNHLKVFSIILLYPVLVLFSFSNAHAAGEKSIQLSWGSFYAATHPLYPMIESWGNEIEKRTKGAVEFTYYPGSTVVKGPEIPGGILKGVVDIGDGVLAYTPGRFLAMEAVNLPNGYSSAKMATHVANEFYKEFKPAEFDDFKVFFLHAHGPGILHTKTPVRSLEEIKGLKIRAVGAAAKSTTALGAVPIAMPMFDVYEALKKGIVQGTFSPIEAMMTWKQAEVVKYTTECYGIGYTSTFYLAMSKSKWDSLPPEIQKVFMEVSAEWIPKAARVWDASDEEAVEYLHKMGNEIIPLSKEENARWAKAIEPVIEDYMQTAEAKGLPAREYIGAIRDLIDNFPEN